MAHVYCLHRGLDGASRQKLSFAEKGIAITSSFDLKVEFVPVNLYEEKLGLNDTTYDKLADTVDMVIHNAWSVNYAFTLKSFEESDLLGLRNLVDLCLKVNIDHVCFSFHPSVRGGLVPVLPGPFYLGPKLVAAVVLLSRIDAV